MKKLILVLAVMLMAAPAMAAVTITATDAGGGWAEINYTSTGTLPRAFALNITVDAGTIDEVDTTGAQPYGIYMGTIVIEADGTVSDYGSPVAPSTDPGALGGLGTSGITVEMGSLYDKANPGLDKPAASGLLIKVKVSESCTLSLASNTTRGNVVLEDATIVAPTLTGTAIVVGEPPCLEVGQVIGGVLITQDMYDLWVSLGSPECWCYPCHYRGDINNDLSIDSSDLGDPGGWYEGWNDAYAPCSDTNNDGYIDSSDLAGTENADGWVEGWNNGCP